MPAINTISNIGIVGAGSMGTGIAQLAACFGHKVQLYDVNPMVIPRAKGSIEKHLKNQVEKGRTSELEARGVLSRIHFADKLNALSECQLIIEAVVEDLKIKQETFRDLEGIVAEKTILATNTSSLSVAAIASACRKHSSHLLGLHFFNPPVVMPLVEIVPALTTSPGIVSVCRQLLEAWGKSTVVARDTPGFIVNRVARPFYGEALRILEEGVADIATIDWAMREIGGFRMGPFELMDFIGNDVNFKVTESVFEAFYYDPRYKPSTTQKRLVESGHLGRKSGQGYYDYRPDSVNTQAKNDRKLGEQILLRILCMLINEAIEAVFLRIATVEDIDLAMCKGVNYPKGLLRWADELGLDTVLGVLMELQEEYGEDRYRPSALLRRMVKADRKFYE